MEGSNPSSSSISTPTPSTSSPTTPSIFRPRRSEDWNKYRPVIEQLYRDDQLKLRDVKRIMEREHNFVASEKQYKDRLAAWNIRKNIKAKEVNIMIRKQQRRAAKGKQTAFRVAGQKVDTKRIARFVRRYGTNWENNDNHPTEPQHTSPEPVDNLDRIPDSEVDETKSLPAALSPTASANDTPKATEINAVQPEDPWHALRMFEHRMRELGEMLDSSTAGFYQPPKDSAY